jgi:glucose-6-phosphate 1-dehydrogenase
VLTIQPEEKISFLLGVKYPESSNLIVPVNMDFKYSDYFDRTYVSAYERLLRDCLAGDQSLFVRQDGVEAAWELADPFVSWWEECNCVEFYPPGSWGPQGTEDLIKKDGRTWATE